MATLTDNPTKTGKRPASVNGAAAVELGEGVKPAGASRVGDVHYWNGKPLPPIFYEDPEPVEDGMLQDETIVRIVEALRRRFPKDFVKGGGFVMYDPDDGNNRFASDGYISFGRIQRVRAGRSAIAELLHMGSPEGHRLRPRSRVSQHRR